MRFFDSASPKCVSPQFLACFSLSFSLLSLFWFSEVFFGLKVKFSVLAPNSNFADNLSKTGQYFRTWSEIEKIRDVTPQFQQISTRCKKPLHSSMSGAARIRSPKKNYSKKKATLRESIFFKLQLIRKIPANIEGVAITYSL